MEKYLNGCYDDQKIESDAEQNLRVYLSIFPKEHVDLSATEKFIIEVLRNRLISGEDIEAAISEVIGIAVEAERHAIFMRYHSHSR